MSCRNPNTEISTEISETLGQKSQNARKCNLKIVGGALKEAIHSYAKIIPNVQVLRDGTEKEGGSYRISGNPRRVIWFCKKMTVCLEVLCNVFFKTYALIPC
jgi:hypothetical protein